MVSLIKYKDNKESKPYTVIVVYSNSCGACHHFKASKRSEFLKIISDNFSDIISVKEKEIPGFNTDSLTDIHANYPNAVGWFPFISIIKTTNLESKNLEPNQIKIFNGNYDGIKTRQLNDFSNDEEGYKNWIYVSIGQENKEIRKTVTKILYDLKTLKKLTLKN